MSVGTKPAAEYLGTGGVAERYGLSRNYVNRLHREGGLPKPDSVIDGVPGWRVLTLDEWWDARQAALAAQPPANRTRGPERYGFKGDGAGVQL